MDGSVIADRHVFHQRRYRPLQVRRLPVLEAEARRRPHGKDRVSAHTQRLRRGAKALQQFRELLSPIGTLRRLATTELIASGLSPIAANAAG
jgi:hypothetical protein